MKYSYKACSAWLKALFPNHLMQTASGKLLGVVFLPRRWDGYIRVSDASVKVSLISRVVEVSTVLQNLLFY
jgi:hypothetical protein